jgi:RHS repeat-associated protein
LSNQAGQLSWVEDEAGSLYLGYDQRGRQTDRIRRWPDGAEHKTWSDFDADGRLVRRGYPDGTALDFQYDERGLLQQAGPIIEQVTWTPLEALDTVAFGNGVSDERHYDQRLRVERLLATGGAGVLRDLSFGLDAASRIANQVDGRQLPPARSLTAEFVYDDLGRLHQAIDGQGTTTWTYDDVANIQSVTSDYDLDFLNVVNQYSEDGAGPDQLTHHGSEQMTYDRAGRLTSDGSRTLTWDAAGRLKRVERDGVVEEYVYAYDGARAIRQTKQGGRTEEARYIDRDAEERGGRLVRYVFLGDQRLVRLDAIGDGGEPPLAAGGTLPAPRGLAPAMFTLLLLLAALVGRELNRLRRWGWLRPAAHCYRPATALGIGLALILALSCDDRTEPNPRDSAQMIEQWPSEMIEQWPSEAVLYLSDAQQSPVVLANAQGEVVSERAYHPFGALRTSAGQSRDPRHFVGNEIDPGSGLGDFQARPYRQDAGFFLAPDPVATFPSTDLTEEPNRFFAYAYSGGDPINRLDASGEAWLPIIFMAAAVLTASSDRSPEMGNAVLAAVPGARMGRAARFAAVLATLLPLSGHENDPDGVAARRTFNVLTGTRTRRAGFVAAPRCRSRANAPRGGPGQFGSEDVAFGLARARGRPGLLVNFGGQATLGTRAPLSEATRALAPGPARNAAIAGDTLGFARSTLQQTGGRLRFNLEEVSVRQALTRGSSQYNSVTSAELRGVLNDSFLRGRADFYRGGANVTSDVLNAAGF